MDQGRSQLGTSGWGLRAARIFGRTWVAALLTGLAVCAWGVTGLALAVEKALDSPMPNSPPSSELPSFEGMTIVGEFDDHPSAPSRTVFYVTDHGVDGDQVAGLVGKTLEAHGWAVDFEEGFLSADRGPLHVSLSERIESSIRHDFTLSLRFNDFGSGRAYWEAREPSWAVFWIALLGLTGAAVMSWALVKWNRAGEPL